MIGNFKTSWSVYTQAAILKISFLQVAWFSEVPKSKTLQYARWIKSKLDYIKKTISLKHVVDSLSGMMYRSCNLSSMHLKDIAADHAVCVTYTSLQKI